MTRSAETEPNVPEITRITTEFPAGGASVRVGEGITVVSGLDHGEVSGRGIRVVVSGESYPAIDPDSGIAQNDARVSTPAVESILPAWSRFSV